MFEIEVQNESTQTQTTLRFVAVPRIGEGVRMRDRDGFWTSYDVLDVWYQRSAFGDVWIPFMHVRQSEELAAPEPAHGDPVQSAKPKAGAKARAIAEPAIHVAISDAAATGTG